jgi:hypothetical protein
MQTALSVQGKPGVTLAELHAMDVPTDNHPISVFGEKELATLATT